MEFDPKWLTDPQVFQVNRLPAHASYMVRGADGAPLEQTWGEKRFLLYYLVCVAGAGVTDAGRLSAGILQGGI